VINTKKNHQLFDYQASYFYQKQRQKRRKRIIFIAILLLAFIASAYSLTVFSSEHEMVHQTENKLQSSARLTFNHPDPAMRFAVPVDMQANIEVNGLLAYTQIKQVFLNPHAITLSGRYQFPLPEHAAINYLKIEVDGTLIEGSIMEKQQAKSTYQQAKAAGKKASLVTQEKANLFTNNIANIPPNTAVVVTIDMITPISFDSGTFGFNLPLIMTERYQPSTYLSSPAELDSQILTTADTPVGKSQVSINLRLNPGVGITNIASRSHGIHVKAIDNEHVEHLITLDKRAISAERNFYITWELLVKDKTQITSFVEQINEDYFTLLTLFPTIEPQQFMPRDVIFIIDTSGSMQGRSLDYAKKSLIQAILTLNDRDSFNIIAFDSTSEQLFKQTEIVSKTSVKQALAFIEGLQANGGTEMFRPLSQAISMNKNLDQYENALRQILFITDGAVSNEFELMKLLESSHENFRLFTVGIGTAPNGYFMKKAAQFGRGSYVFIRDVSEIENNINQLMSTIRQPSLTDIQLIIDGHLQQDIEIFPKKIPDLYVGKPIQLAVKSRRPIDAVEILGSTNETAWYHSLIVDSHRSAKAISTVWGRRKIESLVDSLVVGANPQQVKEKVIETSIAHQIMSPYTSFIAVEKQTSNSLLASNQSMLNRLASVTEQLHVSMPQTALGWKLQLVISIGLYLLLFAFYKYYAIRNVSLS